MRTFDTGAMRNDDTDKIDYLNHFSHRALRRYAEFLHAARVLPDGTRRDAGNFKQGMPVASYMASGYRHMQDLAFDYERTGLIDQDLASAVVFNMLGLLHEVTGEPRTATEVQAEHDAAQSPIGVGTMLRVGTVPRHLDADLHDSYGNQRVSQITADTVYYEDNKPGGGREACMPAEKLLDIFRVVTP